MKSNSLPTQKTQDCLRAASIAACTQRSDAVRLWERVQLLMREIAGVTAFPAGIGESQEPVAAMGTEYLSYMHEKGSLSRKWVSVPSGQIDFCWMN